MDDSSNTPDKLLAVAVQAALKAGELARNRWHRPPQVSEKGFRDLVTETDHDSQALIVEIIQSHFPDHGFLVEEEAEDLAAEGPVVWVVDPIDGTSNYSRRLPNYCVSIAAVKEPSTNDEPEILAGVIYDPMQDELFQAAFGQGATMNGETMAVSSTNDLAKAIIAVDWSHAPTHRQTTLEMVEKIAPRIHTLRAIGSAALALAWVAAGRLDGYLNLDLKPWDVAAGKLLIEEAGGKVVKVDNRRWQLEAAGFIAGNGRVAPDLIVKVTSAQ